MKYTSSEGNQETKDAFLNILSSEGIDTKNIHVNITDGASAAIELIMLGICNSNCSEKIMLFDPTYTNYLDFAKRLNIDVLTYEREIRDDGTFEDLDFLESVNDKSVLVVDCLFGSGIKGKPRGPYEVLISNINKFRKILSVDVPSGFMTGTSVLPSQTVTFHDTKIGMNENNCGKNCKNRYNLKVKN